MTEAVISGDDGGGRVRVMKVDYPGNSKRQGLPAQGAGKEKPKPVVTTPVTRRDKTFLHKLSDAFFGESDGRVSDYLIFEVLIPAAKNMVSDAISEGVNKVLFGDSRARTGSSQKPRYTSYNTVSTVRPEPRMTTRQRGSHDFSDIITGTRGEAEDVLDGLRTLIMQYEVATVSDMYTLAGITADFTDEKWGWTDLRSASIRPARGGYLLVLPRPQALI